jgi:GGDEF domain-containing protein
LLVEIPAQEKMGDRFEHFCIELAKIFRHNTREEDLVGRENVNFGILLPETDQPGSEAVAKRLSRLIQNHPSFQSDTVLTPFLETFAFQTFTYPETFALPESLMTVLEEVDSQRPHA